MSLLKVEQETIILFNEAEATASVYTHNAALQRVLLELCQTHPAQVRQTEDNRHGGLTFELPKKWVKITPPRALSEACLLYTSNRVYSRKTSDERDPEGLPLDKGCALSQGGTPGSQKCPRHSQC